MIKSLRKLIHNSRGAAAVEFALVAPIIFIVIFVLINFGRLYWVQGSMTFAIEAAGRYAMLNPASSSATITSQANANLYGISTSEVAFSTNTITGSDSVQYMIITANASFNFIPGDLLPYGTINLSRKVRVPLIP